MEKTLKNLQYILKRVALRALKTEDLIDDQVQRGQWGNEKTAEVELALRQLDNALNAAHNLIQEVKEEENN